MPNTLSRRARRTRRPDAPPRLGRDIATVLALKLVALGALYFAFFSPDHRVDVSPQSVEAQLIGNANAPSHKEH